MKISHFMGNSYVGISYFMIFSWMEKLVFFNAPKLEGKLVHSLFVSSEYLCTVARPSGRNYVCL